MAEPAFVDRLATGRLRAALKDTPVVMVVGPRQCGKTTLVRDLIGGQRVYLTLDDETTLQGAREDPTGLVRHDEPITIDEVQRAPALLRAIKYVVDRDRRPGRFLLTGSADVLTLPTVSESLAGRLEVITLLPLSRAEIAGRKPAFLHRAFQGTVARAPEELTGQQLVEAVLMGGYPDMRRRETPARRQAWARDYVNAMVRRDARDIADVDRLDQMSRLFRILGHHSGQLTNFSQLGGQIGLDDKTTKKYVSILEQLFLLRRIDPWFRNRLKRLVKTPRLHFLDSGLLAAVVGATVERLKRDRSVFGPLLETFVFAEILKQGTWADEQYSLSHYRDKDQDEVDIVVENEAGALVGVEVKASATVNAGDFKGLRKLSAAAGEACRLGVVLYDGDRVIPFGERLSAAPVSCLWG